MRQWFQTAMISISNGHDCWFTISTEVTHKVKLVKHVVGDIRPFGYGWRGIVSRGICV